MEKRKEGTEGAEKRDAHRFVSPAPIVTFVHAPCSSCCTPLCSSCYTASVAFATSPV
ncbi:MAG: hypothetical protein IKQ62_00625 [Bacteroidaceae bacterium]|nr:hypothetical protein [Bacteroidaceae bacterium]